MEGSVQLQLSPKSVGIFEAFYNSIKPVQLLHFSVDLGEGAGKLPDGVTELPFEFKLAPLPGQILYETYHGVFVTIVYTLTCDIKRGMLSKDIQKKDEFLVENEPKIPEDLKDNKTVPFEITPESLENVKKSSLKNIPNFRIIGELERSAFDIAQPFTGRLLIDFCEADIASIELQLVRVETCGCADGYAKEATEIQNIQICDGDVCRRIEIPIFMVFPRLFTCPTLATRTFKIEFEVNLVIIFEDKRLVTWNFPIRILRGPLRKEFKLYLP